METLHEQTGMETIQSYLARKYLKIQRVTTRKEGS
jgi:hypothetical protein